MLIGGHPPQGLVDEVQLFVLIEGVEGGEAVVALTHVFRVQAGVDLRSTF